jgi:uncharacterized membrane protein AbrB (regulator of aidB expression)
MNLDANFLSQLHALWWIVLLVVCIGAAVAILFGIAMERMRQKDPEPPYRLEFDDFYFDDRKPK